MAAPEQVITLSPADAEALVAKVTDAIQQQQIAGLISPATETKLFSDIKTANLVGKTPSEALQTIIEATIHAKPTGTAENVADLKWELALAPIINSARESIQRLSRPPDVGCAMSVLSYAETSKSFGWLIANTYIAVQVVVRNVNRDQQFVLHDVEYSVNADPSGSMAVFSSGRDKVVVRALASAQNSFDPRNIVVHSAQAVGFILSAMVPIAGGAVGDAAAVYNAGFFPGLDKVWKDMSTDQLNLLNDTGFSSTSTSQTVVPKSSSTMFVTFIPSKQYERAWWTQDCVTLTALGKISGNTVRALVPLTPNAKTASSDTQVPVQEAIQACAAEAFTRYVAKANGKKLKADRHGTITVVPEYFSGDDVDKALPKASDCASLAGKDKPTDDQKLQLAQCQQSQTLYVAATKRPFRKWNGNSVSLFNELSTIVVAGMHIVDESQLEAILTSIDCSPNKDQAGTIIFPTPDTGSFSCALKGKNIGKIKAVRLRNADEAAYVDGDVKQATGDDTSGTVTFVSASLHGLNKPNYSIEMISPTGVETQTALALHFDLAPYVSKTNPPELDLTTLKDGSTFNITGYHLDKVQEIHFYISDPKAAAAVFKVTPEMLPTATQLNVPLKLTELKKIGASAGDAKMAFVDAQVTAEQVLPATLKYKPATAATPAAPKPPGAPVTSKSAAPGYGPRPGAPAATPKEGGAAKAKQPKPQPSAKP